MRNDSRSFYCFLGCKIRQNLLICKIFSTFYSNLPSFYFPQDYATTHNRQKQKQKWLNISV